MSFFKFIVKGLGLVSRLLYFLLAVIVILGLAYILGGHSFLREAKWGSDMGAAFVMAAWIDKFFPRIPFWFPLAGNGVSFTHSYPVFPFYLGALLKRLVNLNFIQAFGLLAFSSVVFMALGIYIFTVLRFRNRTAGLLASIFYLVSPIAWTWLFDWGFYAESISHIFVMPTVIFWDLFFTSFINNPKKVRNRVYLFFTVIFLSLAMLSHFGTGLGLMAFFGFYLIAYLIREKKRKAILKKGILALSFVWILSLFLTAFAVFPFLRYSRIALKAGVSGVKSYEQLKESEYTIAHILGFRVFTTKDFLFAARNISFPVVVSCLAGLGILISLTNTRLLALALFCIFALTLSLNTNFLFWISHHLPAPITHGLSRRFTLVLLRFIIPALAGVGVVMIFKKPFFWIKGRFGSFIKGIFASLAGLALTFFILYKFGNYPGLKTYRYNFGAYKLDLRNIWDKGKTICMNEGVCFDYGGDYFSNPLIIKDWCSNTGQEILPKICFENPNKEETRAFWDNCPQEAVEDKLCALNQKKSVLEQLSLKDWPKFKISKNIRDPNKSLVNLNQDLAQIIQENPKARVDFSQELSRECMFAPYFNQDSSLSQNRFYSAALLLNLRFWSEQVGTFFSDKLLQEVDPRINNLAYWFGINYVFANEQANIESFKKAGWNVWDDDNLGNVILKFPEENSLVDLSIRPRVLVIGQNQAQAYDQVYRIASSGVLPYKDFFFIWGKERIDSYNFSELEKFDVLLLHGYSYKNKRKANNLLSDYVKKGGGVFIDTGWQYTTPDWETEEDSETLEIIPFKKLSWKDLGKTSDFVLEDNQLAGGVDLLEFSPLVYGDQPWAVSSGERSNLKDWAKVVLSVKDYPLVVKGELGYGKVVWSGMNILPHARQGETIYKEEVKFLANLFSWLVEEKSRDNFAVNYQREYPDKVEFIIEEEVEDDSFLLWKEVYYPDFQASLIKDSDAQVLSLDTYRTGPIFTGIKLPSLNKGDKIIYQYRQPLSEKAAGCFSALTFIFLIFMVGEGILLREKSVLLRLMKSLKKLFFKLKKFPAQWLAKEKENEY